MQILNDNPSHEMLKNVRDAERRATKATYAKPASAALAILVNITISTNVGMKEGPDNEEAR